MAQQTAVDWLFDELMKNFAMNYSIAKQINREAQIWAQAKQMMREQIVKAYVEGINLVPCDVNSTDELDAEKYYHKTFGKQ